MFPQSYFPEAYWPGAYWPKTGGQGGRGFKGAGARRYVMHAAHEHMLQESARRQRQQALSVLAKTRMRRSQHELLDRMHRQRQTNVAIATALFSEL